MKYKFIILTSILLLIIGCSYSPEVEKRNNNLTVLEKNIIESETEIKKYEINVSYPALQNNNEDVIEVNKLIEDQVLGFVDGFRNNLLDWDDSHALEGAFNSLNITHNIKNLSEKTISFNYDVSEYFAGAAHPMNFIVTFNYNLVDNKGVELDDLFIESQEQYLEPLSKLVEEKVIAKLGKYDLPPNAFYKEALSPKAENFSIFTLSESGLTFYFSSGVLGPYALGNIEINVRYDELKNL